MGTSERPGGWVEGIGWVVSSFDLRDGDRFLTTFTRREAVADDQTFVVNERMRQRGDLPYPVVVVAWPDGSTPIPPDPFTAVKALPEWRELVVALNVRSSADPERPDAVIASAGRALVAAVEHLEGDTP